jgi:hypothetical protein
MSKKDELLDELFDSAKSAVHYLTGILKDLAEETYSLDTIGVDIEEVGEKAGAVTSILNELMNLHLTGSLEEDVDIWAHYGGVK